MRRLLCAPILGAALLLGCSDSTSERTEPNPKGAAAGAPLRAASEPSTLGLRELPDAGFPGFLVWESNRSGAWRLWVRDLEGSEARRLTPDEPGRRHCCAHVAPDGAWITYLSLPDGKQEYPKGGSSGPLRLIRLDGSEQREVAAEARTYFEHRAALWRSPRELIYIDGDGRTVLVDLESGDRELLTEEVLPEYGYLIDSRLAWAATGRAEFARYRADRKRVAPRYDQKGCQPYFSHDGRWGFWTAGVGGPISRLDLETGRAAAILHKNDERMPPGLGYLYFPMLSRDGSALAFAASRDEHDHFRSDYEVFVVEVDPRTLEPTGQPVRMTYDPATDRFPDVHLEPLALGRKAGEAPYTVEWRAPGGSDWAWDFGDGAGGRGARASHRFERPGHYRVRAALGDRELFGRVTVSPASAPRALGAASRDGGARLVVDFDEPVAPDAPVVRLESQTPISDWRLDGAGRSLSIELARPLAGSDTLHLSGFVDLAERPNRMAPATLPIDPPLWPSDSDDLAFVWATGAAPNLVFDPELGAERASTVEPTGRAVLDHHFRMVLGRGAFTASAADAEAVLRATRGKNRMTLEAFATPGASGSLIRMGGLHLNFALRAEAGRVHVSLRTGVRGPGAFQGAEVARYQPGDTFHLVVSFTPGRLAAHVDGEPVGEWPLSGDFFHWKRYPLTFGEGVTAAPGVAPRLEGLAIYSRILPADEIRENFQRYRAARAARPVVPQSEVEVRLVRRSKRPTLEQISPYREALVVDEWRVSSPGAGEPVGEVVRVARWAILDGATEPVPAVGERRMLTLERFDQNPQLEGVFVADDLGAEGGTLYYTLD